MSTTSLAFDDLTVEDLAARVGAIPLWRIRNDPRPGCASEEDVERILRAEDRICELIDGVLVEKAVNDESAGLASVLVHLLGIFVVPRKLGWLLGPDGFIRLFGRDLRAPDVCYVPRQQRPAGRLLSEGYSDVAPALAIEVFSPGNTVREMEQKRSEFFAAGTELFWIVYPERQEVEVASHGDAPRTLAREDVLDGGSVLPGFSIRVRDLFDAIKLD
jgi:Uma2 family endonuclease